PVLMSGLMLLPGLMVTRGMGDKRIAVLDATGKLRDAYLEPAKQPRDAGAAIKRGLPNLPSKISIEYVDRTGDTNLETAAKPYLARLGDEKKSQHLDGVLLVPPDALADVDTRLKFYSRSATDFITEERLSSKTNQAVHRFRLAGRGLNPDEIDRLMSDMHIDAVQLSKTGEQKKGGAANFLVGFVLTALLILPTFIYGLEIMRGIIQEKT